MVEIIVMVVAFLGFFLIGTWVGKGSKKQVHIEGYVDGWTAHKNIFNMTMTKQFDEMLRLAEEASKYNPANKLKEE
jgi:hypothetical protein